MRNDILIGCDYDQLNMYTPVLNFSSLGDFLHIKIPVPYVKYQICDIYDISSKEPREVDFFGKVQQDKEHPWISIPVSVFNWRSGKHTYRFNFLDLVSDTSYNLFISYVSQDDNPETPYIYMEGRGNTSTDNSWKDGTYADTFYEQLNQTIEETYGYDPLLFGETTFSYCSTCALPSCEKCPYKEG